MPIICELLVLLALVQRALNAHSPNLTTPNGVALLHHLPPLKLAAFPYSRHRCIGPQNTVKGFLTRICRFDNICYRNGRFFYYVAQQTPLLFDKKFGTFYNFSTLGHPWVTLYFEDPAKAPFTPAVVVRSIPTSAIRSEGVYFLWTENVVDANIGHLIWEELGSIYYTLYRFNDFNSNLQVLHISNPPESQKFQRVIQAVLPALTSNPLRKLSSMVVANRSICFERLYVGGAVPLFRPPQDPLLEGREAQYLQFRNLILRHYSIKPYLPEKPVIFVTDKSYSQWAKENNRHRVIANAAAVCDYLRLAFPFASTHLMEWHKVRFVEQLSLMAHASLVITPCGGVSMMLPFLPDGAHAIVMDYPSSQDGMGYTAGESAGMDISFWNRFPHITFYAYQVFNRSDWEWDYPGATDTRNDASILVNLTRMHHLVKAALSTMGYLLTQQGPL